MELIKTIWKDPVWSKVISAGIISLFIYISSSYFFGLEKIFDYIYFILFKEITLTIWLIIILILSIIIIMVLIVIFVSFITNFKNKIISTYTFESWTYKKADLYWKWKKDILKNTSHIDFEKFLMLCPKNECRYELSIETENINGKGEVLFLKCKNRNCDFVSDIFFTENIYEITNKGKKRAFQDFMEDEILAEDRKRIEKRKYKK